MAQLTIGLDLGAQNVKRVRLKSSFRSVEIEDFSSVEIPDDDRPYTERLTEALNQLNNRNESDLSATALPGDVATVRTLQLPFTDNKRIQQTVGFELEAQIPFSLDEVVFDYLKLHKSQEGTRLLTALCRKDQMEHWLEAIKSSGLDPRLVGADCLSYSSLAEYLPTDEPEEEGDEGQETTQKQTAAIVDVGHKRTSVCIMGPDGVEFGRTLSGGGAQITARLAQEFDLDEQEAEEGKRRAGFIETDRMPADNPQQKKVSDAVRKFADSLVRDLRQTFTTHQTISQNRTSKVWLCGGGASIENLDVYLSEQLDMEVQFLRPEHFSLDGIEKLQENSGDEVSLTWVKALGLALHAHLGGRHGWLNLRKGEFSFKGDFTAMRGKIVQLVASVMILLLLAIGSAMVHYFSLKSADKAIDTKIRETTKAILGKSYDNLETALAIINEKIGPSGAGVLPRMTALDILYEVHHRIPKDLNIRLKDINISPTRIRLDGFTDSFESVEKIKSSLEKSKCFSEVKTGRTRKTKKSEEVEFEVTIVNNGKDC